MGLLPVRSGRVAFRDRDITRLPAHERALLGIGYAPEDCGIFPDLSVEENFQITAWIGTGRVERDAASPQRIFGIFPAVEASLTPPRLPHPLAPKKTVPLTRAPTLSPAVPPLAR